MTPTREILWNVGTLGRIAIYALLVIPIAFLTFGLARRVKMWRLGQPEDRFDQWTLRFKGAFTQSVMHGRINRRRNRYGGLMHLLIFWGFLTLFIGTVIVMVEDDISVPFLHYSFYRGNFYLGYKFAMNLAGLMLIAGVLLALSRRLLKPPSTQDTSADDIVLLAFLLVLTVQGFTLQALRLAVQHDPWGPWSF
ncbi:MAG TPA: respiratory nitrate reductase subunit gamma, partial [Nitrolancea sp.]|nr:respiratory nitrate reductase subunit gamma [Nitrolancea sp.]